MLIQDTETPFVSIIIPVYNKEQFLHRCLDSFLNSDFAELEIIVVNDGSTDNGGVICDMYQRKDSRFKVIHQPNAGVSAARNKGLDIATGKWIYFADADDWIDSNAFDSIASAIRTYSDVDFVRTYCREICGDLVLNPDLPADIKFIQGMSFLRQILWQDTSIQCLFGERLLKSIISGYHKPLILWRMWNLFSDVC